MSIIRPRIWTQQPQIPVRIDWSNPLTRGLMVCALPWGDAVSGKPPTRSAGIENVNTQNGVATLAVSNGGTASMAYVPANVGTGNLTDFALINGAAVGGDYIYICGTYSGSSGVGITSRHAGISYTWGAYDPPLASNLIGSGEMLPQSGIHLLVHVRDGTTHSLYRNGIFKASKSGGNGATSAAKFCVNNLVESGGIYSCTVPVLLAGRFSRALSVAEIQSLSANPWQIFTPRVT